MLIESLSEFIKVVGEKAYNTLKASNDEEPEVLMGDVRIIDPENSEVYIEEKRP